MIMKKNILVVDDSALMRRVICDIINSDDTFQVTDVCRDGLEAYEKLKVNRYDGVILDVNMPRMGGLELLERLQKERIKTNVIMVSTMTTRDADVTILAMERGAVDFVTKPTNIIEAKGDAFRKEILGILNAVLKTERISLTERRPAVAAVSAVQKRNASAETRFKNKIVALACSTGGPKALQSVIPYLPANLDAPMVLVQHMPVGFTNSMANRLDEISKIHVKKGPDGSHKIVYNDMPPIGGLKPCANITYDSLRTCGYDQVVCVVLTGMGADGTNGILELSKVKPIYTIAQDAKTCGVYGMPKAIAETGLVNEVVPLTEVANSITKNVGVN